MNDVLMKCGHTAMARDDNGNPVCPICMCTEIVNAKPNLEGRKARCMYCGDEVPSSVNLPFFKYQEDKEYDRYYCGCLGWD